MKKLLAVTVVVAMMCSALTACATFDQNVSTDGGSNDQSVSINEEKFIEEHGEVLVEKYGEKLIELYGDKLLMKYEDEIIEKVYAYALEEGLKDLMTTEDDPLLVSDANKENAVKAANTKAAGYLDDCVVEEDSVTEWLVAEDLSINIAKMRYGEKNVYCPMWSYSKDGLWNCAPICCAAKGIFRNSGESILNADSSFVSKIGEYTVIYLAEYDFRNLEETEYGDNLQTQPIALEYQPDDALSDSDGWYFIMSNSLGHYKGTTVGINTDIRGLIYVMKDMPDDYVFHCGEEQLTSQDIRELFKP